MPWLAVILEPTWGWHSRICRTETLCGLTTPWACLHFYLSHSFFIEFAYLASLLSTRQLYVCQQPPPPSFIGPLYSCYHSLWTRSNAHCPFQEQPLNLKEQYFFFPSSFQDPRSQCWSCCLTTRPGTFPSFSWQTHQCFAVAAPVGIGPLTLLRGKPHW